ncbi:MAG: hypothetical protein VYC43_04465 [Pseudomonadota bacterium]|nr:hypothetical protein [Pseudomonadota bacterium]MEC9414804.1 hypothetical protein [Pseudomonadota bacterium]
MFKYFLIFLSVFTIVSCSNSSDFDPGPCPRAAILKGSESKDLRNFNLSVELNRTVMICEYNLRRNTINFDVGIFGDVINLDSSPQESITFNIFIAFVGPEDSVINKWSKKISVKIKNQTINNFSVPIEGLRSNIEEGRTGSSYKVLLGLE